MIRGGLATSIALRLSRRPLAEGVCGRVRAGDDVAAMADVDEIEGGVEDARARVDGRRIGAGGVASLRELLHGVELGSAEPRGPGRELRPRRGAETH